MSILRDPGGERLFLEGRLEGVSVPDLIYAVCRPGKTGLLTLSRGEVTKTVYIQKGQLTFASSNIAEERLGETLLRSGAIGCRQLEEAVARLGGGKRLGAILVESGALEPANLVRGLLQQVKEIILSLFPWTTGSYRFVEGPLPTAEVITLNIATSKLICDGIRRVTSWPRIVRAVGGSRAAYRLARDGRLLAAELDLGEAERAILTALESPVTVGAICHSVFLPNFDVYQYLWSFRILGIIRTVELEPAQSSEGKDGQVASGTLAETPIGELLLDIGGEKATGLLNLEKDDEERAIHFKDGLPVFATSSRHDDSLTTFLLRRGVIGLSDKEEIERRALTNRRTGEILREMGILSEEEVSRFVREQMLEIVITTFGWTRGEWRFVPGPLPTTESVTLDRPLVELVLHGIRSLRDWSRVHAGCGGLDTYVGPTERFEEALAGAEVGAEERAVLAACRSVRLVGDLVADVDVPDFRASQILWAMKMIGVLETKEAPVVEAPPEPMPPEPPQPEPEPEMTLAPEPVVIPVEAPTEPAAPVAAAVEAAAGPEAPSEVTTASLAEAPPEPAAPVETTVEAGPEAASEVTTASLAETSPESAAAAETAVEARDDRPEPAPEFSRASDPAIAVDERVEPAPRTPLEAVGTGVLEEIERFNRRHREVHDVLRGSVGAGARNLIANCAKRLPEGAQLFAGLAMDETGAFPAALLFERVSDLPPDKIRERLEGLIQAEVRFASDLLDEGTVSKLMRRLETAVAPALAGS